MKCSKTCDHYHLEMLYCRRFTFVMSNSHHSLEKILVAFQMIRWRHRKVIKAQDQRLVVGGAGIRIWVCCTPELGSISRGTVSGFRARLSAVEARKTSERKEVMV